MVESGTITLKYSQDELITGSVGIALKDIKDVEDIEVQLQFYKHLLTSELNNSYFA